MKTVLFQGDSITDTGRSREHNTATGTGYVTLVRGEIEYEFPSQYKMYNRGISGNRVVDLYARIKSDIINLKPDIMSILIGVNDAWHEIDYQNGVDAEKFFQIYCMLIEEIKAALPNVKIMIMEPYVMKEWATEAHWEEFDAEVRKRAEKSKKVAKKYNLSFIPLQEKFDEAAKLAPISHWLGDGVHPTIAGHELIKREWIKGFKKLDLVKG